MNAGKDIMQIEHMPNDIPSGKVASPAQSGSSGRIEAGPSTRSFSLPIELFDVRLVSPLILVHPLSIGPERLTMMSAREFTNLPAAIQHQKALLGQLFIRERPTTVYQQ